MQPVDKGNKNVQAQKILSTIVGYSAFNIEASGIKNLRIKPRMQLRGVEGCSHSKTVRVCSAFKHRNSESTNFFSSISS